MHSFSIKQKKSLVVVRLLLVVVIVKLAVFKVAAVMICNYMLWIVQLAVILACVVNVTKTRKNNNEKCALIPITEINLFNYDL